MAERVYVCERIRMAIAVPVSGAAQKRIAYVPFRF
jgi:hypothetical protein